MAENEIIPLDDYVERECKGNKSEFARRFGCLNQKVIEYIRAGYVVINDRLYKPTKYKRGEL